MSAAVAYAPYRYHRVQMNTVSLNNAHTKALVGASLKGYSLHCIIFRTATDPATGTGTFLRQTILQIYDNFRAKHSGESEAQIKKAWNEYVPKHLLPRLNDFELMMAPYAVAHMKLAMVLKDTGYDFGGDHRLNVFLTNSLEEAGKDDFQMTLFDNDPLAFESIEANQAKKNNGINVIIGNPPYSGESANKGKWIMDLMDDYKKEPGGRMKLQERNPKWLNDDYVKFIRYAQHLIEQSGNGVIALITPHGFIDNPTFRGMRWKLLTVFDEIYTIDLHGNSNRKETAPDGSKDENVFDIQQGVCICLFIKKTNHTNELARVFHFDKYGTRTVKYEWLNQHSLSNVDFEVVSPDDELFLFRNYRSDNRKEYSSFISVTDLFDINGVGITTAHDDFVISTDMEKLIERFEAFRKSPQGTDLYKKFNVNKKQGWDINAGWRNLQNDIPIENYIKKISYRPFDIRYIFYEDKLVWRTVRKVMMNFVMGDNIGLVTARSNKSDTCDHFYITANMMETKCGERTTQSAVFPLYKYDLDYGTRTVNIKEELAKCFLAPVGIMYTDDMALQLFDYIYAVLHSPQYREKYKEFLKMDFPRVPYPTDQEIFWKLVEIGSKLRECHLMQTEFDTATYNFIGDGTNEVVKPEYKNGRVYISKTQFFDNVPQAQWEQYIGGYQPLQKWLKDRKKTMLSAEDIEHYKKIIAALKLTEKLMAEIDQIVEF